MGLLAFSLFAGVYRLFICDLDVDVLLPFSETMLLIPLSNSFIAGSDLHYPRLLIFFLTGSDDIRQHTGPLMK